ncbi:MAG: DsbE family thiol:disulfide interchange protein [Prosthecobacter sp.]|nr:DsbE family thiol:disulfide interchange protein [Prosthecobacter sp.]
MKTSLWRLLPFFIFAALVLLFWRGLSLDPKKLPSVQTGKALPDFRLPALNDETQVLTPARMLGQVSLLNVWASWCSACVDEQVFLMSLAAQGIPIFGLNYKDEPAQAKAWLKEWGNPYQMIGSDISGKVAIDLGVYGAPETFLVDAKGIIRYRHVGTLNEASWTKEFLPKIQMLRGKS